MLKSESWRRCGPHDTEGGEADRSASSPKGQRPTPTVCVRVGIQLVYRFAPSYRQFQIFLGLVAAVVRRARGALACWRLSTRRCRIRGD